MNYLVPTVQSYSLTAEHEITPGTAVSLGYVGSRGTHLDRARNINQPLPVDGYNFDPRLNSGYPSALDVPYAGFATINQKEETVSSTYHSLQGTFKRRMSRGPSIRDRLHVVENQHGRELVRTTPSKLMRPQSRARPGQFRPAADADLQLGL